LDNEVNTTGPFFKMSMLIEATTNPNDFSPSNSGVNARLIVFDKKMFLFIMKIDSSE